VELDPVDQLDREWQQLSSGRLRPKLREWAEAEPALAPFADPATLIRFLRRPGPWAARDALLRALLYRARLEPLAARVVLEALLPGLKRVAERVILDSRDRDELWSLLLACAWEQIRTYPLERRPSRIAANLLLDTRRKTLDQFLRERARPRSRPDGNGAGRARQRAVEQREAAASLSAASSARQQVHGDVDALLATAVEAGAISREEAELIARTRIDGVALHELAAAASVAYHTLNVRRIRAERRLLLFLGRTAVRPTAQAARATASHRGRPA
jgi:hypothetical protein